MIKKVKIVLKLVIMFIYIYIYIYIYIITVNRRYATTRNIMKTQRTDQSTSSKEIWTTLPYSVGIIPTVITCKYIK